MAYLYVDPVATTESVGYVDFVVRLAPAAQGEVRVSYRTDYDTALYSGSGADFIYQSGTLTFAPGETEKTVRVLLVDGTVPEPTELFWLDLYSPVGATVVERYTPAYVHDNDGQTGMPTVSVGDVTVDERNGTASFFVWLDRPSTGSVSVGWRTEGVSAQAGADFSGGSGTLSFAPGEMVRTVTVDIVDDVLAESDETFRLLLENPSGAALGNPAGLATIGRSDGPSVGMPYIDVRPIAVGEGATSASFVVQLSAPSQNEVRVTYQSDYGSATYSGAGADFAYQTGTLVFAPGETTRVVEIGLRDGAVAEPGEVFWLDLYSPFNGVVSQRYTPALVIDNDGFTGTPAISVGDLVVDEKMQAANFFVSLDRPSTSWVAVNYSTADGTAKAGEDYRAASGVLHFAPGEMVKTVRVDVHDDALTEPGEHFSLVLEAPSGATLGDPAGTAAIGHSDGAVTGAPYISATPIAVSEGDTLARFVVQLSAPSQNEVRVTYQTDYGSATYSGSGADFAYQTGTLAFAPGETTRVVEVALAEGSVFEGRETFWLDLYSPVNATLSQRYTSALVLDDDGLTGTPGVRVTDAVVDESAQGANFFVWLDRPSASTVTVDYLTVPGTAASGDDYRGLAGTLIFAPGEMVKTVAVDILQDAIPEGDERFHLVLQSASGATVVDRAGLGLIGRSDLASVGAPQILVQPAIVSEADPWIDFVVHLSAPSQNEVRVTYQTDYGAAVYSGCGADFAYQTATLAFAPGETIKTVRVQVNDDAVAEADESLMLDLYSPVNATVSQRYTTGTIVDDDGAARVLSHGIGDDTYEVTAATDRIVEGPGGGIDTIRTALNNYVLPDQVENLALLGTANLNGFGNALDNVLAGNAGDNRLDGGAGNDTAAWTGNAANYQVSRSGNDWVVSDRVGSDGTDVAVNVERLQFADRTVAVESRGHGSYADLPEALWHFFIVAFDAAPGVTYMDQLAEAWRFGLSVPQIVDIFTSKSQFTEVYPATLDNAQLGVALASNIIKDSASPQARAEAAADIQGALDIGWTVGQMIYTVFGNLGAKAYDDPVWGGTALQFHNQIQVSKYYTEVLNQSTTDLSTLRAVLDPVTQFSDVSSEAALATLIGVALFDA